jgi:hypothetical protein
MSDEFNAITDAMTEYWGARCDEFQDGCRICEAWRKYDEMLRLVAMVHSCPVCGRKCKECDCVEQRLAVAEAMLREAVDSYEEFGRDESRFFLGSQWYERAKQAGGGE